jgi:hypothetical protein
MSACFNPERTLFVAHSWPQGSSSTIYFTTIAAALAQAATMSPTSQNPVAVIIYPGTYSDALTLVSNVHLFGNARRDVVVTGSVTWSPSVGVNVSAATISEQVSISAIRFEGPITFDSTSKPESGQGCVLDCRQVDIRGNVTVASRNNREDHFEAWESTLIATLAFSNTIVNFSGCTLLALAFSGASDFDINGDQSFGTISLADTTTGSIQSMEIIAPIVVGSGCSLGVVGSVFETPSSLTVASGGSADIRGCRYLSNSQLVGPGSISRSLWTIAVSTVAGDNTITLDPPYPDARYSVAVEMTAPGGAYPAITSKSSGSFTLNDPVGGQTLNLTIMAP